MKKIDVCLTPELLHLHDLKHSIVVVTDIFRATSCMVTAFAHGVGSITPVATVEECRTLQQQGYIAAAERDALKVAGFELDNSPFSYMNEGLIGANIAVTTTNGTLSITKAKADAVQVLAGAFLNLEAIVNYLKTQPYDVLVLCAGWKGKVNLEDTFFAGAVVEALQSDYAIAEDAALMAMRAYQNAKADLMGSLADASHIRRLQKMGISDDIPFCLKHSIYDIVPILKGDKLVKLY
jgi:2-phosphosulfolactate phosphatase